MEDSAESTGMTVVNKELLEEFKRKYTDASDWIDTWVAFTEGSVWKTPQDIKDRYSSASFLASNIVIFNVKGNNYRLEVKVAYNTAIVKAIWAGAHPEYEKRNKKR